MRRGASLNPLGAVEIISTVAGQLPPSSERPTRPKVLVSPSLISKLPSRMNARGHVLWPRCCSSHEVAKSSPIRLCEPGAFRLLQAIKGTVDADVPNLSLCLKHKLIARHPSLHSFSVVDFNLAPAKSERFLRNEKYRIPMNCRIVPTIIT